MSHSIIDGLRPLELGDAYSLENESEQLFAATFIQWFGPEQPLFHEPGVVQAPGIGITTPDFATVRGDDGVVLIEATMTQDTRNSRRKRQQQDIYAAYTAEHPDVTAIEVNGAALECGDTTMMLLEAMLQGQLAPEHVQAQINALGRDAQVFQATLARELDKI